MTAGSADSVSLVQEVRTGGRVETGEGTGTKLGVKCSYSGESVRLAEGSRKVQGPGPLSVAG